VEYTIYCVAQNQDGAAAVARHVPSMRSQDLDIAQSIQKEFNIKYSPWHYHIFPVTVTIEVDNPIG
jgi:hypothetical protein